MDDLLAEFIAETREMLEATGGELVAWEADPADRARLDAIFRFVHTVKGNCGFFDFPRLASLSHAAEDALADCRAGRREADAPLVTAVLAIIDRIAAMIDAIEAGEVFPEGGDEALISALDGASGAPAEPAEAPLHAPAAAQLGAQSGAGAGEEQTASFRRSDQRTIRLPVELLDRVMSGVSDMVLARNDLAHRLRQAGNQPTIDGPFERLTTILSDVRDAITRMRMQRIETLFGALPRLVRDLSAELGKQVMVDLDGGDVELDREMIETIRDPLTHIIRNAIDHGIEAPSARLVGGKREIGLLAIAARQSGNTISIVLADDGRGLDEERIAAKAVATGLVTAAERGGMIGIDRGGVVGLVGEAHREAARRLVGEAGDIGLLARVPGGLGFLVAVGAIGDNLRNALAVARADRIKLSEATLILDHIVQQRGNRLILVRPVLERNRGDGEQVGHVGDARAFADLGAVKAAGIGERIVEALGEEGGIGHRDPPVARPNATCARQRGCGRRLR